MIKIFVNGNAVSLETWNFPAGEVGTRVGTEFQGYMQSIPYDDRLIEIVWEYKNNDEFFALAQIVDFISPFCNYTSVILHLPYVPYGRQDRAVAIGEAHALKVFARMLNTLEFNEVCTDDPHSDVTVQLINNLTVRPQASCVSLLFAEKNRIIEKNTILVAPDAGALKKVFTVADMLDIDTVLEFKKKRDPLTGAITEIYADIDAIKDKLATNPDFLVVDDLIDGGGTFVPIGNQLKKLTTGKVDLYVTHGIFSKGVDILNDSFDNVYVFNLMNKEVANHPLIKE